MTFFQNMHGLFLSNQKLLKILNYVLRKYLKNENQNTFGVIKNQLSFSKEMLKFFEDNNVKIYHTYSNLKAVVIERFNRSLRELNDERIC